MSDKKKNQETKGQKTLTLKKKLDKVSDVGSIKQSFSHGRSKSVTVEVKKRRIVRPSDAPPVSSVFGAQEPLTQKTSPEPSLSSEGIPQEEKEQKQSPEGTSSQVAEDTGGLTQAEWDVRKKVLQGALKNREKEEKEYQEKLQKRKIETEERQRLLEEHYRHEDAVKKHKIQEEKEKKSLVSEKPLQGSEPETPVLASPPVLEPPVPLGASSKREDGVKHKKADKSLGSEEDDFLAQKKTPVKKSSGEPKRREHRLTLQDAMVMADDGDEGIQRKRSLASLRRRREKERLKSLASSETQKIVRDVIIPETIVVSELASRMAVRSVEVVRCLMNMGVMATAQQILDADTAELVVTELGHQFKRVSESDVEEGLLGAGDPEESLEQRAPVVTVMGHVDHGKTSLLDALRQTDRVAHEAGGITQHIGAYQVHLPSKKQEAITFLDTPGHAAFTAMRARGTDVTDIVVLVVAADDSVMEQTIEAINHAQAAQKPMVVAINKIDAPQADPGKVKLQLLNHGLVVEEMGGDVLCVEVSAKKKQNITALEEIILLQAEMLQLKANPHRSAVGTVIESRLEKGRGPVATVLVQRGTLKVGDIFIAGHQWGKVRTLLNDHGHLVKTAGPSVPVEVVGFNGTAEAGDHFIVVQSENQAREITEYRERKLKNAQQAASKKTLSQLFNSTKDGEKKILPVVLKTDVQGSLEAISGTLEKLNNQEVSVKVLHGGVGGINESDIVLATASNGLVIGFNVRANQQARELARHNNIEIRYYSIIYDILNDIKDSLSGMLSPELRENYLGTAEIRQVFSVTKVGKIAGCYVREGSVQRGAKVRLLRDNVVIYEGTLKTLKRIKDEVKEVSAGLECGMAFENYQDIREGDSIECFTIKEIQRTFE